MPWLVLTRAGAERITRIGVTAEVLWMGSDVLSGEEIQQLRSAGRDVTVFVHPVRTAAEVADALVTIREHHPGEVVWIEATVA